MEHFKDIKLQSFLKFKVGIRFKKFGLEFQSEYLIHIQKQNSYKKKQDHEEEHNLIVSR